MGNVRLKNKRTAVVYREVNVRRKPHKCRMRGLKASSRIKGMP
jgi:hypothetical protein